LYKLGADIDTLDNDGTSPLRSAIEEEHIECVRVLVQFGANVNSILVDLDPIADIQQLVSNMQSLLQLIANYMSTRPYNIQQVDIDILLPEYAVVFQRKLSIARFETLSLLKLRQLLQLCTKITSIQPPTLCGRTDVELLAALMNLFMCRDQVCDLHSMRLLCKTTYRRSFPVPHHRHIELPIGVIESFLGGGDISALVPFYYIRRALIVHDANSN
jgi:hypothetical protein